MSKIYNGNKYNRNKYNRNSLLTTSDLGGDLSDKELVIAIKEMPANDLLKLIEKNSKKYGKYRKQLGTMNPMDGDVIENLPRIALGLYKAHDSNIMHIVMNFINRSANEMLNTLSNFMNTELSKEIMPDFEKENILKFVQNRCKQENWEQQDLDMFWIQMKFLGVSEIEDKKEFVINNLNQCCDADADADTAIISGVREGQNRKDRPSPNSKKKHKVSNNISETTMPLNVTKMGKIDSNSFEK